MEISLEWGASKICARAYFIFGIYIYNSVLICRQNVINSSASAPLNATKIAVKKVSDVDVCMFGPERNYNFRCINVVFWRVFARVSAYSGEMPN